MQFNDLVRKFFEQILNAELDVPVHATLLYEDETFEVILVPELTEEGEFTLKRGALKVAKVRNAGR